MKYSNLVSIAVAAAFAVAMGAGPVAAGNTKVKPVKPKAPAASAKPKTAKVPTTSTAAKAKPPKAKPAGATKPQTSSAAGSGKATKANKPTTSSKGTDAKPVVSSNDPGTTPAEPGPALPLSKAQEKLLKNENLRAKMAARLGRDPLIAASGFKNLGQFVAAVNVSNNLGIEFNLLKRLMVDRGLSLGQAIQQAKAMDAAGATRIANRAVSQANADITAGAN
jgi:hypothetical protein